MERVVLLIITFLFIYGCSGFRTQPDQMLNVKSQQNLFGSQAMYENLVKTGDRVFLPLSKNTCVKNWVDTYKKHKAILKNTEKPKDKLQSWFELGTCYCYTKEYKKTQYYYEMVLAQPQVTNKMKSIMNFNLAQIYELNNQLNLARIFYRKAMTDSELKPLGLLQLSLLDLHAHEFNDSLHNLDTLKRLVGRSEIVDFLRGVNYFHLNKNDQLINKVLKQMDEKSVGSILLKMALDVRERNNVKKLEADLRNLEAPFSLHANFKGYLLKKLGS